MITEEEFLSIYAFTLARYNERKSADYGAQLYALAMCHSSTVLHKITHNVIVRYN